MSPQEILNEVENTFSENLEMMSIEEKFIIIKNILAQKVAQEMVWKEYYKSCWDSAIQRSAYKEINS